MGRAPSEPIELILVVHHTTEKAFLVSELGDRDKAVWLARSLVERGADRGTAREIVDGITTLTTRPLCDFLVPEWLAAERGLM